MPALINMLHTMFDMHMTCMHVLMQWDRVNMNNDSRKWLLYTRESMGNDRVIVSTQTCSMWASYLWPVTRQTQFSRRIRALYRITIYWTIGCINTLAIFIFLLFIRIKIIQYMVYKNIEDSKIYIKYIGLTKTNCRYRYDIFNYFILTQVKD